MIKVKQKVDFVRRRRNRDSAAAEAPKPGRIPRISRLMALAIRFDGLLRDGIIPDQSELARLGKVTQPRMTQIMNLLHLAPDIQEDLLHLPLVESGRDPIHERLIRSLTAEPIWRRQRQRWAQLKSQQGVGGLPALPIVRK